MIATPAREPTTIPAIAPPLSVLVLAPPEDASVAVDEAAEL